MAALAVFWYVALLKSSCLPKIVTSSHVWVHIFHDVLVLDMSKQKLQLTLVVNAICIFMIFKETLPKKREATD